MRKIKYNVRYKKHIHINKIIHIRKIKSKAKIYRNTQECREQTNICLFTCGFHWSGCQYYQESELGRVIFENFIWKEKFMTGKKECGNIWKERHMVSLVILKINKTFLICMFHKPTIAINSALKQIPKANIISWMGWGQSIICCFVIFLSYFY